jgi:hypothetical protein
MGSPLALLIFLLLVLALAWAAEVEPELQVRDGSVYLTLAPHNVCGIVCLWNHVCTLCTSAVDLVVVSCIHSQSFHLHRGNHSTDVAEELLALRAENGALRETVAGLQDSLDTLAGHLRALNATVAQLAVAKADAKEVRASRSSCSGGWRALTFPADLGGAGRCSRWSPWGRRCGSGWYAVSATGSQLPLFTS